MYCFRGAYDFTVGCCIRSKPFREVSGIKAEILNLFSDLHNKLGEAVHGYLHLSNSCAFEEVEGEEVQPCI